MNDTSAHSGALEKTSGRRPPECNAQRGLQAADLRVRLASVLDELGVLDHGGLIRLFRQLEGRRFLGVVDCRDCVELVFSDEGRGPNLVSIYTDCGRHTGRVALGGVGDPEKYVADWHRWLEEAA
jgi:hypothetical protein